MATPGRCNGQNYVGLYARGPEPHQRSSWLSTGGRAPGREADNRRGVLLAAPPASGRWMQAFVYDGAVRGTHIRPAHDHLRRLGHQQGSTPPRPDVVPRARPAPEMVSTSTSPPTPAPPLEAALRPARASASRSRAGSPSAPGSTTPPAARATHHLAAIDGAVHEFALDEAGTPVATARLERRQVKRPRRSSGRYHFNVGYEVPCTDGAFLPWIPPHAEPGDAEHRRADAVRVIARASPTSPASTACATTPRRSTATQADPARRPRHEPRRPTASSSTSCASDC